MSTERLPYGGDDLSADVHVDIGSPKRIRCFVRGCQHLLRPPTRAGGGDVCPDHGIRCHSSGTYSYADVRRNLIVDAEVFATRVVGHPFKHETHRFNQENSEDALSWNVFRSLQRAGCLYQVAQMITGLQTNEEPTLYLWGLRVSDDSFEPWDLLIAARERFESNLPIDRPLTEPDIALHLPSKYLILIEAKFTSPNSFYVDGPRQNHVSLTKSELLEIYWDDAITSLDRVKARTADRVHNQLWRNLIFAEWMASREGPTTEPWLSNLTRAGYEEASCRSFEELLSACVNSPFRHITWEGIATKAMYSSDCHCLYRYLAQKTAGLTTALGLHPMAQD